MQGQCLFLIEGEDHKPPMGPSCHNNVSVKWVELVALLKECGCCVNYCMLVKR